MVKNIDAAPVVLPHARLAGLWPRKLQGARVGAVLHPASVLPDLGHVADLLARPGQPWRLAALFGPQHGILGHTQDNMIEWEGGAVDPRYGVPVHSLYGASRKPTPAMLEGLDVLLVDLQDVGARYYTFIWTMLLCMEAAHEAGIPVVVLDRPNPLGGAVEGPVLDPDYRSFVGLYTVPIRHGLTMGEMARLIAREALPGLELHVLPMEGWRRSMEWEDTGLPWVLPSPNMPTPDTAFVYPGQCLLEATSASEGRGTTRPFELVGAPWLDAHRLADDLGGLGLSGVRFRAAYFQPTFHKGAGRICGGVQIHVTDRRAFPAALTGIAILWAMRRQGTATMPTPIDPANPSAVPDVFAWKAPPYEYEFDKLPIDILLGHARWREMLEAGAHPRDFVAPWEADRSGWEARVRPIRMYPE